MHTPEAVVYDLDGTLVRLAVDWSAVRADAAAALADRELDTEDESLWDLLVLAERAGHREAVESVIEQHELAGARASERLPLADDLLERDVPVGVCSLNCEAACHVALDAHGLADPVMAVVGRDTVPSEKPDPEPLMTVLDALDVTPDRALFVGDTARDAETARRAGVPFRPVDDHPA